MTELRSIRSSDLNSPTKYASCSPVKFFQPANEMPTKSGHDDSINSITQSIFVIFQSAINNSMHNKKKEDTNKINKNLFDKIDNRMNQNLPKLTSLHPCIRFCISHFNFVSLRSLQYVARSSVCHNF